MTATVTALRPSIAPVASGFDRQHFASHAAPVTGSALGFVGGFARPVGAKGNSGFVLSFKAEVALADGTTVRCQVTGNVTGCKGAVPTGEIGHQLAGMTLEPRQFSTGSLGWYGNAKVRVGGADCQCGINVVAVGSKPTGPVPF